MEHRVFRLLPYADDDHVDTADPATGRKAWADGDELQYRDGQ